MDNQESISVNIRYKEINVNKFSLYDIEQEFDKSLDSLFKFQSNFNFKIEKEKEQIICLANVKIAIVETKEVIAELTVENIFELKPLLLLIKVKEDGEFEVPNAILSNLISLTISTLRGVLSEKLKGTIVQNEVYPLVDPSLYNNFNKVE